MKKVVLIFLLVSLVKAMLAKYRPRKRIQLPCSGGRGRQRGHCFEKWLLLDLAGGSKIASVRGFALEEE